MRKLLEIIDRFTQDCAIWMLIMMCVCVFIQIVARYVSHSSQAWTDEFARYSFMMLSYSGAAIATRNDANLRMDFLLTFLKGMSRKCILVTSDCLMSLYCLIGIYMSYRMTIETWETGEEMISINFPVAIIWGTIPVFFTLIFIQSLLLLYRHISEKPAIRE